MGQAELQAKLSAIPGVAKAYFQPPANHKIVYPCVIYSLNYAMVNHANDNPYRRTKQYQVIVIDEDPNSTIPDVLATWPMCRFERFYTADKLNHYVFNLYF